MTDNKEKKTAENNTAENTGASERKKRGSKPALRSRARHGVLAVAITVGFAVVIVVLNVVVGLLTDRFPELKLDLTSNKAYALQEDTVDYMSHLKKDVDCFILSTEKAFTANGEYFVQAKNLLEKMESCSDRHFKVSYIDTANEPGFTKKYPDVDWQSSTNVAVVACGDNYRALTLDECFTNDENYAAYGMFKCTGTTIEQAAVTATLNVTTEDKVVVDVLTGHQELDSSAITTLLNNNAYQVNEVNLLTGDLDDDALFVLLFAPSVDLDEETVTKLSDWLENDGKYGKNLIYIPNYEQIDTPNLDGLLEDWGIERAGGYVYETNTDYLVNGASKFTFVSAYGEYYTEGLKNPDIPVIANQVHAYKGSGDDVHELLVTSDRAGVIPYEPKEDWKIEDGLTGEAIPVALESVRGDQTQSRLFMLGSDAMYTRNIFSYNSYNNSGYLMNIFNTISHKEDQTVVIESKSLGGSELGVVDVTTNAVMIIIFVIVLPVAMLVIGLIVWLIRRNK